MKKPVTLFAVFSGCLLTAKVQQDLAGFRTGNYTGVNGVFLNSADIADSRYRLGASSLA